MSRALIVVGHEFTSWDKGDDFKRYLQKEVGIKIVKMAEGWNRTPEDILMLVENNAILAGRQPFLLAYIGHGDKDGWGYGIYSGKTWMKLPYDKLADTLAASRRGPTLIVNDCCYADALTHSIIHRIPNDEGYGVIAACQKDGYAYGNLTESVLGSWAAREVYQTRVQRVGRKRVVERRWGTELDHHFFAKPGP